MAERFFLERFVQDQDNEVILSEEETHHILRVMRKKKGQKIHLLDGSGYIYEAQIMEQDGKQLRASILSKEFVQKELAKRTVLIQSLCKGEKMDWVVQKATELGVQRIIPIESDRSDVHYPKNRADNKITRWKKIAQEATKQCGRGIVPDIDPVESLHSWAKNDLPPQVALFVSWENEDKRSIQEALDSLPEGIQELWFAVGPEGGWSPEEIRLLQSRGAITIGLGKRILRTETAGLLILSSVFYAFGDQT